MPNLLILAKADAYKHQSLEYLQAYVEANNDRSSVVRAIERFLGTDSSVKYEAAKIALEKKLREGR